MVKRFQQDEPEEVRAELVAALVDSSVPVLVLAATIGLVGLHSWSMSADPVVLAATLLGLATSLYKVAVMMCHRRALRTGRQGGMREIRRWERGHAVSTMGVAASVAFFVAAVLALPEVSLHLGATCILFAYCAGVTLRVSIRPRVALAALFCAGSPPIAMAAAASSTDHLILALVFTTFLLAAIQSVDYAYTTALRGVTLRLQMARLARLDPLTGLLNRHGLREAFDAAAKGARSLVAVHAFDLDGFKAVNDGLGHAAGDRLLAILAGRIRPIAPDPAIVARTGGDEFILVQFGVAGTEEARRLAARIHDELTAPCDIGGDRIVRVGLSLGFALGALAEADLDELTHRADAASYVAKRAGGGIRAHGEIAAPSMVPALGEPQRAAMA
ncbi:GGDEF domain-containing protein [Aureimonas sp. SK2]|uniref:GGDEF domain-containing protein n=1 Tax=Aureimonas sp. SK2 TaxID=3015992 RepID=UPI0024444C5B|nr:GGDEF domain-containing protein [Aureimonas sp. SK2]